MASQDPYPKEDIIFFLSSCINALIAYAASKGIAPLEKMQLGLAKDRVIYREDLPYLDDIEMEQKLLRITARRLRWEYKMPRDEHPEMYDPWFWPFGLKLMYMNELHPDAQHMLFDHPERRAQALQQQHAYPTQQQSHGSQAPYYEEDNNQYDGRSETQSQEYPERQAQLQQYADSSQQFQEFQAPYYEIGGEQYAQSRLYNERSEPQFRDLSEGQAQATPHEFTDSFHHNQDYQTPHLEEEGEWYDRDSEHQPPENQKRLPQIEGQQYTNSLQHNQEHQAPYPDVDMEQDFERPEHQPYTNPERLALIESQQSVPSLPLSQEYPGLNPERLAQIEKQQFADSLRKRNREYQAQVPYSENPREQYDMHSKSTSQRRNQLRARTERLSPELQALRERAMATKGQRSNKNIGTSQVDQRGHVPHLGFDAKHRPYYSIILEDNRETCELLIGRIGENGINIKTVEAHFDLRFLQFQKHNKTVSIWVEDDGDPHYVDEERRKRLRFAWHFLQAWADQVVLGRKERAEHRMKFWIPTIREFLEERWKDCEASGRYPDVSREPQEPRKGAPKLSAVMRKQLKRKEAPEDFERESEDRTGVAPDFRYEKPSQEYRRRQLASLERIANGGGTSAELFHQDKKESNRMHQDRIRR